MKTIKLPCNCQKCATCKGTGKIVESIDYKTMTAKEAPCPSCEGKDNFAKCYQHMQTYLDEDDRKRYESYQRRSA